MEEVESCLAGIAMGFSLPAGRPAPLRTGVAGIPGMSGMPVIGVADLVVCDGAALDFTAARFAAADRAFFDAAGLGVMVDALFVGAATFGFAVFAGVLMPGIPAIPCIGRRAVSCCAYAADEKMVMIASALRAMRATRGAPHAGGVVGRVNIGQVLDTTD